MSITSTSASVSLHAIVVALLLLFSSREIVRRQTVPDDGFRLFVPRDVVIIPDSLVPSGPGGSGASMPFPVAQGELPRPAPRVFVPPLQVPAGEHPLLEMPPSMDAEINTPIVKLDHWGDPFAQAGLFSNGRGRGGTIGDGAGGVPGNRRGNTFGDGDGDGIGRPGVFRIGGGVSAPRLIYKFEPEYSEEARKAKYQGSVTLRAVVDEHGIVRQVEISQPLGMGLDEKAIDAVRKWRFQPGRRDGQPVPVWAVVEVNFRLL